MTWVLFLRTYKYQPSFVLRVNSDAPVLISLLPDTSNLECFVYVPFDFEALKASIVALTSFMEALG